MTGTILYVESDGRHVAAISSKGEVLWNRDPFADAHLELYRTDTPQIVFIGAPLKWMKSYEVGEGGFVTITYNSSQFGLLNIANGDFRGLGQD
ncbi:MAG TPA: hypothetical protein VKB38_18115 [Terracidiphilus sp.]|nr:hypothetical protein [Terracidiphilus sp.]